MPANASVKSKALFRPLHYSPSSSVGAYISETTDKERWHVQHGTIDLLQSNLKMRFVAPGDWIRIKFDLKPLARHACGESYLRSRQQAGEPLRMVYFGPMRALCETSLLSVFHDLQLYSLLDLYFACATMDINMDVFFDDYRVLQLTVTTTPPSPSLTLEGASNRESAEAPMELF